LALRLFAVALLVSPGAWAQTSEAIDRTALRVCADPGNLPFSDRSESGFENEIAELIAGELDVPVRYTWFPQATGFVRNTLQARKCDVVIGISLGFELLQNTNPYYRSSYVLIYRTDSGLTVNSLADPALKSLRLGVVAGTPPATLMARYGLMGNVRPYHLMVDSRFKKPGLEMLRDVVAGEIDVGALWGPIAGYYAKQQEAAVQLIPLVHETEGPKMDYRITMGIRFGEPDWKHTLNGLIEDNRDRINAILMDYGVPLLDQRGALIPPPDAARTASGVAEPETYRMDGFRAPTPATIKGGKVITTEQAKRLVEAGDAILIDVLPRPPKPQGLKDEDIWRPKPRYNIPGSVWLPNTGFGALSEPAEAYFKDNLSQLTGADQSRPLLIYCLADCWMSWNAAKRAISYGYRNVYWYPEGTDGWTAAGLPTEKSDPTPVPGE
jgi:quinoprotein dehydrogenase-associated probable ABC transporter substrate-binding protein/PQQ-dependent catabolism-associated CXXCW motif protein